MAKKIAKASTSAAKPVASATKVAPTGAAKIPAKSPKIAARAGVNPAAAKSASQNPYLSVPETEFNTKIFNSVCFPDDNRPTGLGPVIGPIVVNPTGGDSHITVSSSFIDPLDKKEKITKYEFRFNPNLDRPKRPSIPVIGATNLIELMCPKDSGQWTPEALRANQGTVRGILAHDPNLYPRHRQAKVKAKAKKAELQLESFQNDAVAAGLKAITTGGQNSTKIEMPTGTGKTLVAWSLMHEHIQQLRKETKPTGSVVFVVNSLPILKDAEEKLETYFPEYANGIRRCYENPDNLMTAESCPKVYFTTPIGLLNLLPKLEANPEANREHISHAIYDEVHHLPAATHSLSLESLKAAHPDVKVVGYSATPFRTDQRSVTKHAGETAYSYSHLEAWRDGYLPTVKITRPSMPIQKSTETEAKPIEGVDLGSQIISYQNILDRYIEAKSSLYNGKTLILVNTTNEADKLAKCFKDNDIKAAVYHSKDPETYKNYQAWNGNKSSSATAKLQTQDIPDVLITVNALKEGVDARPAHLMICKSVKSFPSLVQIIGRGTRVDEGKTHLLVSDMAGVTHNSGFLLTIMNYFKMIHEKDVLKTSEFDFDNGYMNYCHELMGDKGDELDLEMFKLDSNIADNIRSYISQEPEYLAKAYGSYDRILQLEVKTRDKELNILDRYIAKRLNLSGDIDQSLGEYFKALRVDLNANGDSAKPLDHWREELINVIAPGINDGEWSANDLIKITPARKIVFKRLLSLLDLQTEKEFRRHLIRDLGQVLPEFAHKFELILAKARMNMITLRKALCPGLDNDTLFSQYLTNPEFIKSLSPASRHVMNDIKLLAGIYPDHPWFEFMGASKNSKGTAPLTYPGGDEHHCLRALYEAYCKIAVIRKPAVHTPLDLPECLNSSPHLSFGLGSKLKVNDIYDAMSRFEIKLEELGLLKREDNPLDDLPTQVHALGHTPDPDKIIDNIKLLLERKSNDEKMLDLSDRIISNYRAIYHKLATALRLAKPLKEYQPILDRFADLIEKGSIIYSFTDKEDTYELRKALDKMTRNTDAKFSKLRLCRKANEAEAKSKTELSSILLNLLDRAGHIPGYKFMTLEPSSTSELSSIEASYKAIPETKLRQEFLNNIVSGLMKVQEFIKDNKLIFVIPLDRPNSSFFKDLQEYIFIHTELDVMGPFSKNDFKLVPDRNNYRLSAFPTVAERNELLARPDVTKSKVLAAICRLFVKLDPSLNIDPFPNLKAVVANVNEDSPLAWRFIAQCLKQVELPSTRSEDRTALELIEKYAKQLRDTGNFIDQDLTTLGLGMLGSRRLSRNATTEWTQAVRKLMELYVHLRCNTTTAADILAETTEHINRLAINLFIYNTGNGTIEAESKKVTGYGTEQYVSDGRNALKSAMDFLKAHKDLIGGSKPALALAPPVPGAKPKTIYFNSIHKAVLVWLSDVGLTRSTKQFDSSRTNSSEFKLNNKTPKPKLHLDPNCKEFLRSAEGGRVGVFSSSVARYNIELNSKRKIEACPCCCDTSGNALVDYLAGLQREYVSSQQGASNGYNFEPK